MVSDTKRLEICILLPLSRNALSISLEIVSLGISLTIRLYIGSSTSTLYALAVSLAEAPSKTLILLSLTSKTRSLLPIIFPVLNLTTPSSPIWFTNTSPSPPIALIYKNFPEQLLPSFATTFTSITSPA